MVVAEKTCQVVVVNSAETVSRNWGSSMIDRNERGGEGLIVWGN